ncbi:3-phosphoshikimate 1-carboxyvinyltransferase [Candidatus Izimaplasma bacterium ZiA1]|uniref:3-phosphoshikimate 1-carboxyvinyltransferase n=1 Tax=Candidatus Izimoplasma sp. ZiA1 TaxID=2024899 RepID=UPI000BAA4B28|nr:3-phosphoshikimate 1-carboxyvinyltransferase [Candidatus Izimaplasma bacterium ZiA1]
MDNFSTIKLLPSTLEGTITAPPSKSFSHRAIIAASLCKSKSTITNIIYSDDVLATIEAMQHLGVRFKKSKHNLEVMPPKRHKYSKESVFANESGSTLRFAIPLFSVFSNNVNFTGKKTLLDRPIEVYEKIFKITRNSPEDIMVNGFLKPNNYIIPGNVSSQFISGLLFSLPLLNNDSTISLTTPLESSGYVKITIEVLKTYNIEIKEIQNGYFIKGNQQYISTNYNIEGDFSNSAFFLVAGLLQNSIETLNLSNDSVQGDRNIIDVLKQFKSRVVHLENGYMTSSQETHGTVVDISQIPDLGPPIALLGVLSKGKTIITNITRLKAKESDRVESIITTLATLGGNIYEKNNEIHINGKNFLEGGTVDSFNDHRIVMMATIASLRSKNPIIITNANAVRKSFPAFFKTLKTIGLKYEIME